MRARALVVAGAICAVGAAALVACTDLFHGTSDILNICDLDAEAQGCPLADATPPLDAGPDADAAPPMFQLCVTDSSAAHQRAETACKWLGACESPLRTNRFAECMVRALETYDCTIAKNRAPKGTAADFWTCLAQVDGCGAVDRCVFPKREGTCDGGSFAVCGRANPLEVAYCTGGLLAQGEACIASGRSCVPSGSVSFCGGAALDGGACIPGCSGSALEDCDEAGVNIGLDCNAFGGQGCSANGGFPACQAEHGTPCSTSGTITCAANGSVSGCPSGVLEIVDCAKLTAATPSVACDENAPGPQWDVSRGCFNTMGSTPCGATPDSCSGAMLSSCVGGVTYTTSCGAPFTGCATTPATLDGNNARCTLAADAGR